MSTPQVVSFSGGRTSAYLVHLMEQRRLSGEEVHYVYMDTGAEHKGTYEFIKKLAREMVSDDSAFATVIFGEGVTEEQAAEVENLLHKENKEMEINVIDGGQPVYYYIISVE